ncbi:MAG: efflux RND transporter permease subunit [Deltaproteobacteria bacterium]|nr:efflux RND transporter permease subunit [Deltaproteobacteria bacterium]
MGAWLQRHSRSLLFLMTLLALGGALAALRMPVAIFPRVQFPRIVVNVDSGDRPVDRMVVEVTQPLEQALRGVPGVRGMRSTSSRGSADISVNFEWGSDMVTALLEVESAVNRALPRLPRGTSFTARRMDPTVFPVLGLALTSARRDLVRLRDFAYFRLRPVVSTVPGVARVEVLGGGQAEYQVLADPARLQAAGLSLKDVADALSANNVVTAVGRLEDRYRLYLALSDTRLRRTEDIRHTVLRSGSNGVIELGDVAEVREGEVPQWFRVTANGRDAVLMNIMQQPGANTVSLVREIDRRIGAFRGQTPADIRIKPYYDQSELVVASALSVRDSIFIGAVLAAVILLMFLRSLRITVIIAIVLPGVLAATVLLLDVFHMSFNIMTLGGMAAAVGLIVDDGVVMLEFIMRRMSEGRESGEAREGPVLSAAIEMTRPLAGSSLATIVVYIPLAFLGGVTGGFFKALALTVAASLVISFFAAYLAIPLLGHLFLKRKDAERLESVGKVMGLMHRGYERWMAGLLGRPWLILPILLGLGAIGYLSYTRVGSGFMPHMDEGGFILDYKAAPGTSVAETDRLLRQVEAIITSLPEVDSYSRRTGLQLGGGVTESNEGDFFIHLKPPPRRGIDAVMSDLRRRVENQVPGLRIETAQLMEDLIGDLTAVPQPVEVKLFSDNEALLRKVAPEVAAGIRGIPGVVEVFDGITIAGDAVGIRVDRVKASLEGLDPDAVSRQIQAQLEGNVASQVQAGEKMIGVRIWTPPGLRDRISLIRRLRLRAPDGHYLPVKRVAEVGIAEGQAQVTREDLRRMVAVTGRIEGRDLGSTMREIRSVLGRFPLPAGAYLEYGGLYREQQKSFRGLVAVFLSAIMLVTVLLLFLYERFTTVLSILLTTLLSMSGVFLGLWVTGTELNISAMMGMTMIVGIVTEIAIFYFAELDPSGAHDPRDLIAAGRMRMRPIVMTSMIAILALMPLALGIGTGAAMQTPLAIAIISGLLVAVPLVLVFMPALYLFLQRIPRSRTGRTGAPASASPGG